jgi:hypothetical protein
LSVVAIVGSSVWKKGCYHRTIHDRVVNGKSVEGPNGKEVGWENTTWMPTPYVCDGMSERTRCAAPVHERTWKTLPDFAGAVHRTTSVDRLTIAVYAFRGS